MTRTRERTRSCKQLSFQDLAPHLVSIFLTREPGLGGFFDEAIDGDALLGGDVANAGVDFLCSDAEVRPLGRLLLDPLVDHALDELLVELGLGGGQLRSGRDLRMNLEQKRTRAVAHVAQQNGVLADDGNDPLGDRGPRNERQRRNQESSDTDRLEPDLLITPNRSSRSH